MVYCNVLFPPKLSIKDFLAPAYLLHPSSCTLLTFTERSH